MNAILRALVISCVLALPALAQTSDDADARRLARQMAALTLSPAVQLFTSKKSIDDPLGDAGGAATGGIAVEWKNTGGTTAFAVFAYLGTAFQLPQLP